MDLLLILSTSEGHGVKVSANNHGTVQEIGTSVSHVMFGNQERKESRTRWIGYGFEGVVRVGYVGEKKRAQELNEDIWLEMGMRRERQPESQSTLASSSLRNVSQPFLSITPSSAMILDEIPEFCQLTGDTTYSNRPRLLQLHSVPRA